MTRAESHSSWRLLYTLNRTIFVHVDAENSNFKDLM